jgi:hypothetical protein
VSGGPVPVAVGDQARLRKAHPCGGFEWEVTRIGADIGLRCRTCGRKVLLTREDFERRVVRMTAGAPPPPLPPPLVVED